MTKEDLHEALKRGQDAELLDGDAEPAAVKVEGLGFTSFVNARSVDAPTQLPGAGVPPPNEAAVRSATLSEYNGLSAAQRQVMSFDEFNEMRLARRAKKARKKDKKKAKKQHKKKKSKKARRSRHDSDDDDDDDAEEGGHQVARKHEVHSKRHDSDDEDERGAENETPCRR